MFLKKKTEDYVILDVEDFITDSLDRNRIARDRQTGYGTVSFHAAERVKQAFASVRDGGTICIRGIGKDTFQGTEGQHPTNEMRLRREFEIYVARCLVESGDRIQTRLEGARDTLNAFVAQNKALRQHLGKSISFGEVGSDTRFTAPPKPE